MATFTAAIPDKPFFLQAASGDSAIAYSAQDFRALVGAFLPRVGVTTPTGFYVTQNSPVGWSVVVAQGYARVPGSYLVRLTDPVTVNLNSINKNPSSTRTHKVWIAVYDKLLDGTEYTAKVVVTEDTNGSGAPDPANAAGALNIATIVVNSGMSYISQNAINNSFAPHTWVGSSPVNSWINIRPGFNDSYAANNTAPARAIYHNGQVTLEGAIDRDGSGARFNGGNVYTPLSVDSVIRPRYMTYGICGARVTSAEDLYVRLELGPDGTLNVRVPVGYNPSTVFLNGFTYFLD